MSYEKAQVLISQRRFDLAIKELRKAIAQDMDNSFAHSMLAMCLSQTGEDKEALKEAQEGVRLDPNDSYAHYILSNIYLNQEEFNLSELSIREALRLNPYDADYLHTLAINLFNKRQFEEALAVIDTGLEIEPENIDCLNLKARLLVRLGRQEEANHSYDASLNRDPDNAMTHTSQGWALLEQKEYEKALEHFREALRLDPQLEFARTGMVEALKAKHVIYRWFLQFNFWMASKTTGQQYGLMIGLILVANFIPYLIPFYLGLVFFTWFSDVIFNTLLRFNQYGKHALSDDQYKASNYFLLLFGLGLGSIIAYQFIANPFLQQLGYVLLLLLFPVCGTFRMSRRQARRKSGVYLIGTLIVGAVAVASTIVPALFPFKNSLFYFFIFTIVAYTWYASYIDR